MKSLINIAAAIAIATASCASFAAENLICPSSDASSVSAQVAQSQQFIDNSVLVNKNAN